MRNVKMGVIGTGVLGRHHARLYKECAGVELVGIYDSNPEVAKAVAGELGLKVFQTIEALAAEAEGVSIAVPTHLHFEQVDKLLDLGVHVLVEKPITETVDQAKKLVAKAAEKQLVLAVGHVERFNPVLETLQQAPGRVVYVEGQRLASYPPPRPGLLPRGTEVSVVHDLMIHDIDVILSLIDSEVEQVDAVGAPVISKTEDIVNARIAFVNGTVANLTASRISQERMRRIRVFKTEAYFSLDYQEQKGDIVTRGMIGLNRKEVPVREGNALKSELEDFCQCVRQRIETGRMPEPRVSGTHGLKALEVADEIVRKCRLQVEKIIANQQPVKAKKFFGLF